VTELTEKQDRAYRELRDLYDDIVDMARDHPDDKFWQGKKDGFRSCFIFFAEALDLDHETRGLKQLRRTSNTAQATPSEIMRSMLKDAMYYIGEALWMDQAGEPLHPTSRQNWQAWVSWYKWAAQRGIVEDVTDSCYREE